MTLVDALIQPAASAPADTAQVRDAGGPGPNPLQGSESRRRLTGDRLRAHATRGGWALTGVIALLLGQVPAARVPIIADDLGALYTVSRGADGSVWKALTFGLQAGTTGGHFNPIGQAVGALYHFSAYQLGVRLGVSPHRVEVVIALGLIALTVGGAAAVLVWGSPRSRFGHRGFWPVFAAISVITAVSLQIHVPGSNDPVVSFAPAGWGSAALGFWTVAWALRAMTAARSRTAVIVTSVLAVACVEYYEMLLSAVAAVALATVLTALLAADRAAVRARCLVLLGTGVALPLVLFVVGRWLTTGSGSYGGTTLSLGTQTARTWSYGMISSLPGGGWKYYMGVTGAPTWSAPALWLAAALCLLVGAVAVAWSATPGRPAGGPVRSDTSATRRSMLITAASVAGYWILATASHSMTEKYSREIQHPGQVYMFYAVGVVACAVLIAMAVLHLGRRLQAIVLVALLPLVGVFVVVQTALNVQLSDITRGMVPYNARLVALSVDSRASEGERCDALAAWLQPAAPEYYEEWLNEDLQANYEREFGTPFCRRLLVTAPRFPRYN